MFAHKQVEVAIFEGTLSRYNFQDGVAVAARDRMTTDEHYCSYQSLGNICRGQASSLTVVRAILAFGTQEAGKSGVT